MFKHKGYSSILVRNATCLFWSKKHTVYIHTETYSVTVIAIQCLHWAKRKKKQILIVVGSKRDIYPFYLK